MFWIISPFKRDSYISIWQKYLLLKQCWALGVKLMLKKVNGITEVSDILLFF